MGVHLRTAMPIIRPEERVEHIQIPGRSGDLTQTEGEDIFNSYIHTAEIVVTGWQNVRNIYKWLRGSGELITSAEPDRKQKARVIGAITLNRISRNMDRWAGEAQFYCQPLKELLNEEKVTLTASGNVVNRGDVISHPYWAVTVASNATSVTLTVSRTVGASTELQTITVTGVSAENTFYIDSQTLEVWNYLRELTLNQYATGVFPTLRPGTNTIGGSGWSQIKITRRERYL